MSTLPRVTLPTLRGFIGMTTVRKTTSVSANRSLYSIQGATTDPDEALQDVVNALVTEVDAIPDLDAPGAIGATTPAAVTATTITAQSITLVPSGSTTAQTSTKIVNAKTSTTDATATTIYAFLGTTSSIVNVRATVVAVKSDDVAHWEQDTKATFLVDENTEASEMGTSTESTAKTDGTTAGMGIEFAVVGAIVSLKVTGRAAETWLWGATIEITTRTTTA